MIATDPSVSGPVEAQPALEMTDDPRLARALEEYSTALKTGRTPDRLAFLARFPEIAEELAGYLDGLDFLGAAAAQFDGPSPASQAAGVLGDLGDFRLLREIGRGGMGIVYEAEQLSLGRRVALKVLPFAATMNPCHLQRFHNEARAAASLHHPHIVPVYAVSSERGVHYYAMQFIEGQSLEAMLREQRQGGQRSPAVIGETVAPEEAVVAESLTPGSGAAVDTVADAHARTHPAFQAPAHLRRVAELGIQAAEALEHAHSLGVVHRDIKPANLLLDREGQLWIADFGLARTGTVSGLTATGDLLGTWRYMSPEQALAKHGLMDHRTDIYSLGVTLYEMLTLQPATDGKNQQEILRQLIHEEPRSPRSLNPAVPADLDTIVLKAAAKEPNERYATARELAEDLRRFLEDRPIQAKRPTAWQRLRKWSRRHRAYVVAGCVAILFSLVALAVGIVLIQRQRDLKDVALQEKEKAYNEAIREKDQKDAALKDKERALKEVIQEKDQKDAALKEKVRALKEVTRQKNLAQFHLSLAQVAVHDCLTNVAQNPRLKAADFHDLRKALLTPSVNILQALVVNYENDPELQGYLADVYSDLAFLWQEMGEQEKALKAYQLMRGVVARLAAKFPDKHQYRLDLARAHHDAATILCDLGRRTEAEPLYKEAVTLRKKVIQEGHDAPGLRYNLGQTHICLGLLCSELGRQPEALAYYDQALTLQQQLVKEFPKAADYREGLAMTFINRANLFLEMNQVPKAETACQEAIPLLEKLVAEFPRAPEYRQQVATSYNNLSNVKEMRGKHGEAVAALAKAISIQEKLVADFPKVPALRLELARSHINRGRQFSIQGKPAEALTSYRQALAIDEELVKSFPKVPGYAEELAICYKNMGHLLNSTQPDAALPWFTKAIDTLEPVLKLEKGLARARDTLSKAHWGRAEAHNNLGRHGKALQDYDRAVELADGPMRVQLRAERAITLAALKEHARAREEADAVATGKDLNGRVLLFLAIVYSQSVAAAGTDAALAERHAARAVELLRRAAGVGFKDVNVLKKYPQFAPLRRYQPFQDLLKELEKAKDGQSS